MAQNRIDREQTTREKTARKRRMVKTRSSAFAYS